MVSPRTSLLSVVTLALLLHLPTAARAQAHRDIPDPRDTDDWLERSRQLAKDAFAATRSDPKKLARARLAVAREGLAVSHEAWRRGRTDLNGVLRWSRLLLKAESADPSGRAAAPIRALERHWLQALEQEREAASRYGKGQIDQLSLLGARSERLQAEIAWAEARSAAGKGAGSAGVGPFLETAAGEKLEALAARAKAKALKRTVEELRQERREVLRAQLAEYLQRVRDGKVLPGDSLRELAERWLEAERDALGSEADPPALAEQFWDFTKWAHDLALDSYEVGRVTPDELGAAAYFHLDAELRWLRARTAAGKRPARGGSQLLIPGPQEPDFAPEQNGEARLRAKAKFAATQKTPAELLKGKFEAARTVIDVHREMMLAGKLSADDLRFRDWWPRLLEAKYAARGKSVDRAALAEARWRRVWEVKKLVQVRHEAGQIGMEEYLLTIEQVLDAELAWARARALPWPK